MKRIILSYVFVLFSMSILFSQVVKIESGISISSMKSLDFVALEENLYSYSGALGVDYWWHKYFYLSSEVGYVKKGGKQQLQVLDSMANPIGTECRSMAINYLHFNTTFRLQYPIEQLRLFVGMGPTFDILLGERTFRALEDGDIYSLKRVLFGVKPEVGCAFQISNKINLGFSAAWLLNIGGLGQGVYSDVKMGSQTTLMMMSIGYKL